MNRILPAIDSLDQHLYQLELHAQVYRPVRCPHCGAGGIWRHGHYQRKVDREGKAGVYRDPVPVPRFYCHHCRATCSRLPSCLAPHRWYPWMAQQAVLALLLSGSSLREVARRCRPGRHTLRRWRCWLDDRFGPYSFHLRSRFPELGRYTSPISFWSACLRRMSLADAMGWLDQDGVAIP